MCDQKAYEAWNEHLQKHKNLTHEYLLLPESYRYQSSGMCTTRGSVEVSFALSAKTASNVSAGIFSNASFVGANTVNGPEPESVSTKSAALIAEGAAQMARFNLPATVKCQGDPRIRPFGTVFIAGTGDLTDGFWIVREAHHMFHKIGDYQLELKIATDGMGDTATTPFRNRTDVNVGTIDLGETLATNGIPALFFTFDSVQLIPEVKIVKESNQGFNRTPNKWRRV
jgi:hypothetical protein